MNDYLHRLSQLRERWAALSPKTRRLLTLGAVFIMGGALFAAGMPDRKPRTQPHVEGAYEFHTPNLAEEVLTEKLQANLAAQSAQIAAMAHRMEQLERERKQVVSPAPKKPIPAKEAEDKKLMDEIGKLLPSSPVVQSPEPLFLAPPDDARIRSGSAEGGANAAPGKQEATSKPAVSGGITQQEPPPPLPRGLGVLSWQPPAELHDAVRDNAELHTNEESDTPMFYMPSASFFEVQLLTGLDAPTGNKARNSPAPIAFRVQDLAWLPNEVRQNVRGCLLLAEGVGELSTERVNVRGLSLSCVDNEGRSALDQKLLGYVADSDGKAGLRGVVASKAGKLLAETMKAGFVQGLAEFFSFNARTVSVTDSGAVLNTPDTEDLGKNLAGGAFSGMSTALEKVSDYYMDLAEEVFPVIQVGATRKATFILTQGAELHFNKRLYGKEDTSNDL